jgi:hypothetical protein
MENRKKQKRAVYTHNAAVEEPSASSASNRRIHTEHHPAPPRSPETRQAADAFDHLMGFAEDDAYLEPVTPEGPAALKVKVKKRYENSVGFSFSLG